MSSDILLAYHCAPEIVWVKDAGQTILVDRQAGRSWLLRDWKAVLWDLLSLGYVAEQIIRFLVPLLDVPPDAAREELLTTLEEWESSGLVCSAVEGERG